MTDYSTLTKTQLQEEIDRRNSDPEREPEFHVARTGNNPELIERLIADDARLGGGNEDLLDDEDEPEPDNPDMRNLVVPGQDDLSAGDESEQQQPDSTIMADPNPPQPVGPPAHEKLFEARYPFSGGELGTSLHLEFLQRIAADAAAAGNSVKGGAYRERIEDEGGQRYAVYRVHLRRG